MKNNNFAFWSPVFTIFDSLFALPATHDKQSNTETLPADLFLERFSLPRVVRLTHTTTAAATTNATTEFSDETLKSSISNGSSNASASSSPHSVTSKKQVIESTNGELYLLYRYLRARKMYHGVNAKNGSTNRKKGVIIPQDFPGTEYSQNCETFSAISDDTTHTVSSRVGGNAFLAENEFQNFQFPQVIFPQLMIRVCQRHHCIQRSPNWCEKRFTNFCRSII